MAKLPKFTASLNKKTDRWQVSHDATDKVVKTFDTKADMTARGVLRKAIGGEGSVKIQKANGACRKSAPIRRVLIPRSRRAKGLSYCASFAQAT